MFKCNYCGFESLSVTARFCSQCGPNGPSSSWSSENVDQESKVLQYEAMLSEYFFHSNEDVDIEKISLRMRERLKISHAKHLEIFSKMAEQKKAVAHLFNFRFEFNENVTDAYAGHDTFLDFRFTNLSENDAFKVSLLWDDPETKDRFDLRIETKSFVKPLASMMIGGSTVFDRIGIKEISELQITIIDEFGESACFRVEPFRFKVLNHDQRVTNNISTHNQISIDGHGVVDATGMGADKREVQQSARNLTIWKQLGFSYLPRANEQGVIKGLTDIGIPAVEQTNIGFHAFEAQSKLSDSRRFRELTSSNLSKAPEIIEVRVPDIGDFKDVVVIELLVKVGDVVDNEQSVITAESDKASLEIASSSPGIVKELKVKLGDKVSEGSLVLLLEPSSGNKANLDHCPPISIYVPSTRHYSRLTLVSEVLELMRDIRAMSKHWHILVAGSKSVPKLLIRNLILKGQNIVSERATSSGDIGSPKDFAAIVTNLDENSLFELDGLDDLYFKNPFVVELFHTVFSDFQLDIMIGEGEGARSVKLDLQPFFSITYCKDINKIPVNVLSLYDCCMTLDE